MADYPTDDRFKYDPAREMLAKYPRPLSGPQFSRSRHPGDDGQSCLPPPILAYTDGSELRAYSQSPREQIASTLMGDNPTPYRARLVSGLLGTTGGGSPSALGGLLDWVPYAGTALQVGDAAHNRDPMGVVLAVLPAARRLAGPRAAAALDRVTTVADAIDRSRSGLDDQDVSWVPSLRR